MAYMGDPMDELVGYPVYYSSPEAGGIAVSQKAVTTGVGTGAGAGLSVQDVQDIINKTLATVPTNGQGEVMNASLVPSWLAGILGLAGAGYSIYQALGGGEGGGLFGNNLLGGDGGVIPGTDIALGGPGLPEPSANIVVKEWKANGSQFYLLTDGRIAVYSKTRKRWKVYRPPKLAVIGKNMPSHKMLTRLRRYMKKQKDDANTVLKIADPVGYAKKLGYRRYRKRR